MRETGLPFDDIRQLASNLPKIDENALRHTSAQLDEFNPAVGRGVRRICEWYSAWSGRSPAVHRAVVTLFAGTHGLDNRLTDNTVSRDLHEMLAEASAGNAMLNRICHQNDLGLKVFDLALQIPVGDISEEAALDEKGCAGTIGFGMEAIAGGADLLCVAALEPRISVSNLALLASLHDMDVSAIADNYDLPEELLKKILDNAKGHHANSLELLRRLGGRETAALCGAILAARSQHIPVIVDSVAGLAALSILKALDADSVHHCMFAQSPDGQLAGLPSEIGVETLLPETWCGQGAEGVAMAAGLVKSSCLALQGKQ
jgi:nicotinate-nucleotide--dimethylbenzimidazole phosphoribosyltransferase